MNDQNNLEKLRHSAAHLLAQAVLELYPDTLLTIGPATKDGFFYDFLPTRNFKEENLPSIESKMQEIVKQDLPLTHEQINKEKARVIFKNNPFKLELIEQIPGNTVGLSRQGDFYDLCRGGHVKSTGELGHVKLLGISGAYWRADKKNAALQRITGTAFSCAKELDEFLRKKEDAIQFDHRRLGKQLDLFSFHDEGVGFPFFHPKGKVILNKMIDYLRKLQTEYGYQEISTPIMLNENLWKRSGHYAFYKDNMYFSAIDDQIHAIRPMNCPGAFLLYNERPHSYRELPLRLAEFGLVHRHELSGVLHGLMRARSFTIDDAHIICTLDQLENEISNTIELTYKLLKRFGFSDIKIGLSTKPDNAMGSTELWKKAETALANALKKNHLDYTLQEGEGAFYGPKIEFKIMDSMGREWQCGTIQVDFFQSENFNLTYIAPSGKKERPVVIHRAIYGSLERFLAIILEHYKGKLPFWLSPTQIKVLTITDAQLPYALQVAHELQKAGFRVEVDESSDQISAKIKSAQILNIPWMIIIGKKEQDAQALTLRFLDGTQEQNLTIDQVLHKAHQEEKK